MANFGGRHALSDVLIRNLTLVAFATLVCAVLGMPARAQGTSVTYERTRPVTAPAPSPQLRIVQPTAKQVMTTRRVDGDKVLRCLLDNKDRMITIAADNWPVKPGGPGVLIVVDDVYAMTVHDLSKPISMESLEPFTEDKDDGMVASPISKCGWHSIAVMPTTASGQMVATAPVVTWFLNKPTRASELPKNGLEHYLASPLVIINWPLLGTYYPGEGDTRSGWKLARKDKIPFDFTVAQVPACGVVVQPRDLGDEAVLTTPGLTYIKNVKADEQLELDWMARCPDGVAGASADWKGAQLYAKAPAKARALKWPAMSSTIDAAGRASERAAHRLPGKKPYDGVFRVFTSGGLGSLTCPSPITVKNSAAELAIELGALTFGAVHVAVDADGYINSKSFKLPRPKPIKGKKSDGLYDDEAAAIAGVEVSGEFFAERSAGKAGKRLELKIDIVGPDGEKTGHGCNSMLLVTGYSRPITGCSNSEKCGTQGYEKCCQ